MRRGDEIIQLQQRRLNVGLGFKHVKGGAGDLPALHGIIQVLLINDAASCAIQKPDAIFHP